MMRMILRAALVAVVLPLALAPVRAGWDRSPGGNAIDRALESSHPHVRYPDDRAYPFGTVNVRGGRKTPYIERCHWTVDTRFFGIPRNFRQICIRYTPGNTK